MGTCAELQGLFLGWMPDGSSGRRRCGAGVEGKASAGQAEGCQGHPGGVSIPTTICASWHQTSRALPSPSYRNKLHAQKLGWVPLCPRSVPRVYISHTWPVPQHLGPQSPKETPGGRLPMAEGAWQEQQRRAAMPCRGEGSSA